MHVGGRDGDVPEASQGDDGCLRDEGKRDGAGRVGRVDEAARIVEVDGVALLLFDQLYDVRLRAAQERRGEVWRDEENGKVSILVFTCFNY